MEKQYFVLYSMPIDELIATIRECIKSDLLKHMPAPTDKEELITSKDAIKILGITLPTLYSWRKAGKVKFYRIGSHIRYKEKEVMEVLKAGKVESKN